MSTFRWGLLLFFSRVSQAQLRCGTLSNGTEDPAMWSSVSICSGPSEGKRL